MNLRKNFLVKEIVNQGKPSSDLNTGQIGVFLCQNGIEGLSISEPTISNVILACGSWYSIDIMAPSYAGLKNPTRSKEINFRKVESFRKTNIIGGDVIKLPWNNHPFPPDLISGRIDNIHNYDQVIIRLADSEFEIAVIFLYKTVADNFINLFQECLNMAKK